MKLDGIIDLYKDMKQSNIDRYKFPFTYNKVNFDVFFLIDSSPFILMFGVKAHNFYFELEVKNGFYISDKISQDKYKELCEILGLQYDPNNPFKPSYFFNEFNKSIPKKMKIKAKVLPQDIGYYKKQVEESDRIYFIGWRNNNVAREEVSEDNLEKTRQLISEQAYTRCKDKNISSRWATDEKAAIEVYMP